MNKMNFITILLTAFLVQLSTSKDLFTISHLDNDNYVLIKDMYPDVNVELIKDSILFLQLNQDLLKNILNKDLYNFEIDFPFFNQSVFNLKLELFSIAPDDLFITRHTEEGAISSVYETGIKTYRIINNNNVSGVFIFSQNDFKAVFAIEDEIYQIGLFNIQDVKKNNLYFISNIKNSPVDFEFLCSSDLLDSSLHDINDSHHFASASKCVDIAIEIDYFTFQSFTTYQEAIDWALEIIAVVSELFIEEISIGLKSSSAQVWEVEDPYASFIGAPQDMLLALRDNWYTDESLLSVDRDLVHLFSKRSNTGTGGIAFLNGVGSQWNGYGFSSNLTGDTEYVNLPVPYFFWNIYCFAHELGHNFGANHTQWCGWEGGPIDNCANHEEVFSGECEAYLNNPQPEIGTIMSYCHTWSYESGGGIMLKFHDIVKNTIMAFVEMQNIEPCDDDNMIVLGCLDQEACNFNSSANTNDGTCIYADIGYDCFGNCVYDENEDGICDDTTLNLLNNLSASVRIYPNPTSNYLRVTFNTLFAGGLSLKLFNAVGQLILSKSNISNSTSLDISELPDGLYNAQLMVESGDLNKPEILNKNIIIQ